MGRRPRRSTPSSSSAASDVYKRQDSTTLIVRGSSLSPSHRLSAIKGGHWDEQTRVWRFPVNRDSFESLRDNGVVLHPTVQSLNTSSPVSYTHLRAHETP